MSIIKILWETIVLLIVSIIQVIGVIVEGIAKMSFAIARILEKAYGKVLDWRTIEKKKKTKKEVHIDIPL